jgi:hypothetical protein
MASKPVKIVTGIVGVVLVIVIAGIIGVFVFAGDIIKTTVEELGPQLTKAEVKLAKVDLSLTSGEAALSGLKIGNPAGFQTPHAFQLGNIGVKIDTSTIGSDTIVIKEILINAPNVIAEFKKFSFNPLSANASIQESLKTSNFIAIQNNVDAFIKAQGSAGGKASGGGEAAKSSEAKEGPKLIIEKFRMTDVKVRAVAHDGLKMDTALPAFSISLDNIGKKENGLPPAEIAAVLIPKVQDAIVTPMTGDLTKLATDMFSKLGGGAKDAMKAITDGTSGAASETMKKVTEGASGATKSLEDGAKSATGALKNLFGK